MQPEVPLGESPFKRGAHMKLLSAASSILLISMNAAIAQQLECKTITGSQTNGGMGNFAQASVTTTQQKPPLPAEWKVTGGGCDFSGSAGAALIVLNGPITDGWTCKGRGFNDNAGVGVTASAIVCHITK
jgi:hypothetical protein